MSRCNPNIFREYDIRGIVDCDLLPDVVRDIGRAYGTYLQRPERWVVREAWPYGTGVRPEKVPGSNPAFAASGGDGIAAGGTPTVIVGRDNRRSSPDLYRWLVEGLLSVGCDVLDIGVVVTPVFYFSRIYYGIEGGIMITGSHNPPEFNGFKLGKGPATMYGPEIQAIKAMVEAREFIKGAREGRVRTADPVDAYLDDIAGRVKLGKRKLKVAVDCGNGTASFFAPRLLEKLGCDVIPLYCESDPCFPNHFPDPVQPENLRALICTVTETGADIGLAYDGDADRIGAVDEKGEILWGDVLMALFWREILPRYPGALAIVEVKCSQALIDEIKRLGGRPVFHRTGHSLIKATMRKTGAVFTGEMSGHMFFADEYYGYDDALYASARLLRILSNSEQPMSALWADVPRYRSTPEVRVDCPDCEKFEVVDRVRRRFSAGHQVIDVDGARVVFPEYDGWALVRASNTQPVLVLRAESRTEDGLAAIKREVEMALAEAGLRSPVAWGDGD